MVKARSNLLPNQILDRLDRFTGLRDLHLELALAETKGKHLVDGVRDGRASFLDHVMTRNAEVHITVCHKVGNVGRRQEHERNGQVLDECHIKAVCPLELNVGAAQERQTRFIQTTWGKWQNLPFLGIANKRRSCKFSGRNSCDMVLLEETERRDD